MSAAILHGGDVRHMNTCKPGRQCHVHVPALITLRCPFKDRSFHVWQIFTHLFIHNPRAPISFLINCLVFYFFAAPVENAFGFKRFLILFYISALGGALCGLAFSSVPGFNAPFLGMLPSVLSMIVIFGLLNPESTILLMFVLPIKAKYISYGTALITFLTFLAMRYMNTPSTLKFSYVKNK
jgi:membrane associated rhomboid family serine protease